MEHIREIFPPHSPQLPSENSHGFASEALSLLLVEGGPNNHALHGDVGDGGKAWLFHVFSTYFCQVSEGVWQKSDFLLRGTPVGLLEICGSPEPQWPNGKTA